jgi:hypothetical protein
MKSLNQDRLGICLSILCLVHCLITPAFLLFASSLAFLNVVEEFHNFFAIILLVVALLAFYPGYRLHHDLLTLVCAFVGLLLILISAFWSELELYEVYVTIMGSGFLIYAHVRNIRLKSLSPAPG